MKTQPDESSRVWIELPFVTPSLNQYLKWHWSKRARFRDQCCWLVRQALNSRVTRDTWNCETRLTVNITRYGSRTLDNDNFIGGCKPLLDALHYEGVIFDDTATWLYARYHQVKDKAKVGTMTIEVR